MIYEHVSQNCPQAVSQSQSEQFVDETFEGSLPAFIAAFTQRKGISQQEAAEIRRMIDAAAGKE